MIKTFFKNLPVILLAAAVAITFSYVVSSLEEGPITRKIEIKVEDILLVVLGVIWIANILIAGKKKLPKPPLFFPIIVWLSVGFFGLLTNWLSMNIGARGFFFFLKEVEFFFLYFYLFYHIKSISSAKLIIKIWIFLGLINMGWVVYQAVRGIVGYYGPGAIGEESGSFPSGGFFLILFIFLFNILLFYYFNLSISKIKKTLVAAFTVAPAFGLFATGSRTAAAGFFFALFLTFLLYFLKRKKKIQVFLVIIIFLAVIIFSYFFIFPKFGAAERAVSFLEGISIQLDPGSYSGRSIIWKENLKGFFKEPLFLFFGMGKSVYIVYGESHNQFVRNFIETGIIGSLVFFSLIFAIIKMAFYGFSIKKEPLMVGLSSGLFVATLTMLLISLVSEPFIIVKIAETYWFFAALTMAVLTIGGSTATLENEKKY